MLKNGLDLIWHMNNKSSHYFSLICSCIHFPLLSQLFVSSLPSCVSMALFSLFLLLWFSFLFCCKLFHLSTIDWFIIALSLSRLSRLSCFFFFFFASSISQKLYIFVWKICA